jgi:phenylacetate-CoA ligase
MGYLYNKLMEGIVLPLGDKILKTSFIEGLRYWRSFQYLSKEELANKQRNSLDQLLKHASTNINYYKGLNVPPNSDPYTWLKQFPILTKQKIKDNLNDLMLTHGDTKNLVKESSSGSSGIQGTIYMSKKENAYSQATLILLWEWAGYRLGDTILQLGMTTQRSGVKKIKDIILRTEYQQAFNIDRQVVLNAFKGKPHDFFGGYASGLYEYANFAKEAGITNIKFKSVISWGDKMFPHYRKTIEEVFHTKVFETYGCTEGIVISGACEYGNQHILSPHVHLELIDANGNEVAPGEQGFVVVTRLDAYTMPLIRYYLGDIAVRKKTEEVCPCGRKLPMLEKIIGRDTDIVVTASGKKLIVHFFTGIFEHVPEIRQFRVIQHSIENIEIEIIPSKEFSFDVVEKVKSRIYELATETFPIKFTVVEKIPPTASGKPQIIMSKLPKAF